MVRRTAMRKAFLRTLAHHELFCRTTSTLLSESAHASCNVAHLTSWKGLPALAVLVPGCCGLQTAFVALIVFW